MAMGHGHPLLLLDLSRPPVCRYCRTFQGAKADVRTHVEPYLAALQSVGVETPDRVTRENDGGDSLVIESNDIADPDDQRIRSSLLDWLGRDRCASWSGNRDEDPSRIIWDWLSPARRGRSEAFRDKRGSGFHEY